MTRDEFLKRLKRGLAGAPASTIDEIMEDYDAHFAAGAEAGRTDAEIAEALGDPKRLARELKLEAGIRRWKEQRNPSTAVAAIIAFLGLGALDILFLLPILLGAIATVFALYVAMLALFVAGGAVLVVGPFSSFPGGAIAALLCGVGMLSLTTAFTALLTIVTIGLINLLMWYGRLHYQVLKPAIEHQD